MNVVPAPVMRHARMIVASPYYLARFARRCTPQELHQSAACHRFTRVSGLYRWSLFVERNEPEITPEAALMVNERCVSPPRVMGQANLCFEIEGCVHEDLQDGQAVFRT